MTQAVEPPEETKEQRTHIAGCTIFVVIFLTALFVVGMATYLYHDYKDAFVSISEENAKPATIVDSSDQAANTALDHKFENFSKLVLDKKPATLKLSIDEINLAIAHFDKLSEFKGRLFVTGLTSSENHENDLIETRASFTVKPGFNPNRYMNGIVKYRPAIAEGSIFPIIEEAIPDTGNPVPEKILQAISTLMFTEYRNDESIKNVFHKLSTVKVIDGHLIVTSDPTNQATPILDREITEERKNEVVQYIALLCFIFVTTIAFAIWFRGFKKRQKKL